MLEHHCGTGKGDGHHSNTMVLPLYVHVMKNFGYNSSSVALGRQALNLHCFQLTESPCLDITGQRSLQPGIG